MATDPKAAAAAAQAAAEAARAAAAEAAREAAVDEARAAARAAATEDQAPEAVIAGEATRDVLVDTGAVGAGDVQIDGSALAAATDRDIQSNLLDEPAGRESLLGLPGLAAATSIGTAADLDAPTLGSSAPSGGDIGKSAIASGVDDFYYTARGIARYAARTVTNAVADWADETFDGPASGPTTEGEVDGGTPDPDETSGGTDGEADPDLDAGTAGDEDTDDPAAGGTAGGGAAGGGAVDPGPDGGSVVLPPGWVNPEDLDFIPGERKTGGLVAGASGQDPTASGDGDLRPGPQGGSWTVNPNPEGDVATNVQTAVPHLSGVDLFGQPPPDDDPIAGDPALMAPPPLVDPNTVNPSRSDTGETFDGGVQASTAYRTMAAPGIGEPALADPLLDGAESSDPADAMAPLFEDDDPGRGGEHGGGHGRDFGHGQGKGHGPQHESTEDDDGE